MFSRGASNHSALIAPSTAAAFRGGPGLFLTGEPDRPRGGSLTWQAPPAECGAFFGPDPGQGGRQRSDQQKLHRTSNAC